MADRFCPAGVYGFRFSGLLDILRRRSERAISGAGLQGPAQPAYDGRELCAAGCSTARASSAAALAYYKVDKNGEIDRTFRARKRNGPPSRDRTRHARSRAHALSDERRSDARGVGSPDQIQEAGTRAKGRTDHASTAICRPIAAKQLEGKKGAIVVLNPQTGDVLAMYSNPSFSLAKPKRSRAILKLEGNKTRQAAAQSCDARILCSRLDVQDLYDDLGVSRRQAESDFSGQTG